MTFGKIDRKINNSNSDRIEHKIDKWKQKQKLISFWILKWFLIERQITKYYESWAKIEKKPHKYFELNVFINKCIIQDISEVLSAPNWLLCEKYTSTTNKYKNINEHNNFDICCPVCICLSSLDLIYYIVL